MDSIRYFIRVYFLFTRESWFYYLKSYLLILLFFILHPISLLFLPFQATKKNLNCSRGINSPPPTWYYHIMWIGLWAEINLRDHRLSRTISFYVYGRQYPQKWGDGYKIKVWLTGEPVIESKSQHIFYLLYFPVHGAIKGNKKYKISKA